MNLSLRIQLTTVAGSLGLLAGRGQAQCDDFTLQSAFYSGGSNPVSAAIGDLNGDGRADLLLTDPVDQTISVLLGTPSGFAAATAFPAGSGPRGAALGDFDKDGDLDVAVADEGYVGTGGWADFGVTLLWNDGSGGFANADFLALPPGEIRAVCLAAGDLDQDGDLDLAVGLFGSGTMQSRVASFVNDGTGHFGAVTLAATGWGPVSIRLGDIDGDGLLDAVTANTLGDSMSVLHGDGDGSFTPLWGHSAGTNPTDVALGDYDGDGWLDACVSYRFGILVLHNLVGTLDYHANLASGLFPQGVDLGDLDGDGRLDLVSVDYLGNLAFVFRGDGAGGFALDRQVPVSGQPAAVSLGDTDGDLDLDLVLPVAAADGVTVLSNECLLSTYCVGKLNSLGCSPSIRWSGTPSASGADDFHVMATEVLAQQSGVVFFGRSSAAFPFFGGTLCLAGPFVRTPVQGSGGTGGAPNCSGSYDFHATQAWLAQHGWQAGDELFAQYWSRDPLHPDGTGIGLSNALRCVLVP